MKRILSVCAALLALTVVSCKHSVIVGNGKMKSDDRQVAHYDKIVVDLPLDIRIHAGSGDGSLVKVNADENLLSYIKTEVKDNTLRIYRDELVKMQINGNASADISISSLNALTISGAGEVNIDGNLTGKEFALELQGAGDISIANVNVDNLTASMAGAGSLEIKGGAVNTAEFNVAGTGGIEAYPLVIQNCTAGIAGAGGIEVSVVQNLTATVNGVGGITYKGNPHVVSSVNGVGTIHKAED